jgi:hypothetical protein
MSEDVQPQSQQSPPRGDLRAALVALAGMPDDAPALHDQLLRIAVLVVHRVAQVDYASVTAERFGVPTTVAMTGQVAQAVDEAQYAEGTGPCLEALDGQVLSVDDIASLVKWPYFRDVALGFGLRASLSIPLAAGRGDTVAALNLYGRDMAAVAALGARVVQLYGVEGADESAEPLDDEGAQELLAGLEAALAVRASIQRALGVLIGRGEGPAGSAYLVLRDIAAAAGSSLPDAAAALLDRPDS